MLHDAKVHARGQVVAKVLQSQGHRFLPRTSLQTTLDLE